MITVIICCYNSATRLPDTLQHLARQRMPANFSWEILLVDNASTDDTSSIAIEIWQRLLPGSKTLNIIYEARAGQIHARMRGAIATKNEILIFCDDDNWLDPNYVCNAFLTMQQFPAVAAAGGQNIPFTDADTYPDWFETYRDKYALGVPAPHSGDITSRGFILGAGMITRKSLFLEMYDDKYPSLLKGRKGENLSTGDDFEYCKRLILRGCHLYYNQNLTLTHFIPKERLTLPYRENLMKGILEAGLVINEYDLAIRVHNRYQNKNRWRLLILTPFRILWCRLGFSKRVLIDEELTLFYLSPFDSKKNLIRAKIKDFIYAR